MNSRYKWIIKASLAALGFLLMGTVNAAMVFYKDVGIIQGMGHPRDAFQIEMPDTYKNTNTDSKLSSHHEQWPHHVIPVTTFMGSFPRSNDMTGIDNFNHDQGSNFDNWRGWGWAGWRFDEDHGRHHHYGSITPAPVPLPAAAGLLVSGLMVLGFVAWRRRNEASYHVPVTKESYLSAIV